MALRVIGAGFGRTGTESMKLALERLGLGPCHHMTEVLANPNQLALWRGIAAGGPADWDRAYDGYVSALDWPTAFYWRELSEWYPAAKILLTTRPAEDWYASFSKTILLAIGPKADPDSIGVRLIRDRVFDGRPHDRELAIATYERNVARVQAAFPPDRLLTYRIGDGWEPLCAFLDRPVPDEPFPHANQAKVFQNRLEAFDRARRG